MRPWGRAKAVGPQCGVFQGAGSIRKAVGRVADSALQIFGGMGYMKYLPVERFYCDLRLYRIYEGTSEIQRMAIARELTKE